VSAQEVRQKILSARGLTSPGNFEDVSFELSGGEILGVAGLAGSSGKDALLPALVGLVPATEGEVEVNGSSLRMKSPRVAQRHGVAYLPRKREEEGVITGASVQDNLLESVYERLRNPLGLLKLSEGRRIAKQNVVDFGVKTRSVDARIDTLSGGNRQKVMLARLMNTSPVVLLLDEPTRGVDIGAKVEIMNLIRASLTADRAVMVTMESEEELVELCDRILVVNRGRLVRTLSRGEEGFTSTEVYRLAQGVGLEPASPGSGASA
jgi:ABC-type sugar transport system ATPase subunit